MKSLQFLLKNLDQYRRRFLVMLLAAFADGAMMFLIPILLAEFTKTDLSFYEFYRLVPYIIGCFIASLCLQWFLRKDAEAFAKEFANHLRLKYFGIIAHLDLGTLGSYHSGYLFSLITKICEQSSQVLFSFAWLIAHSVATLILFFVFTAGESAAVAALNLLVLVAFILVSVVLARKIVPYFADANVKHAKLVERYVDLVSNISTVKRLSIFSFAHSQIAEEVQRNVSSIRSLQRVHADRWFILHSVYGLAFLSTICFLLYRIAEGTSSASALILFVSAYGVIRSQVERLSELVTDLLGLNAYTRELDTIASQSRDYAGGFALDDWASIEIENVKFGYDQMQRKIEIPSFQFHPGDVVSITGESGQGKSTFLAILGGFRQPDEGRRVLNGQPFESYSEESLAELFSLVSQDTELLNISVRANLHLGKDISDRRILDVLADLNLTEWIEALPAGLDTIVGEKGFKLSAGQRQRVNIARALLLDRPIILFDEPTSHLDEATEQLVVRALQSYLRQKSAVFVTHRPSVKRLCNKHLFFENGILGGISG